MEIPSIKCYGILPRGSHDYKRGRADRWTDVTKQIVTFLDYANAHNKVQKRFVVTIIRRYHCRNIVTLRQLNLADIVLVK
jgi:hypothetical protein